MFQRLHLVFLVLCFVEVCFSCISLDRCLGFMYFSSTRSIYKNTPQIRSQHSDPELGWGGRGTTNTHRIPLLSLTNMPRLPPPRPLLAGFGPHRRVTAFTAVQFGIGNPFARSTFLNRGCGISAIRKLGTVSLWPRCWLAETDGVVWSLGKVWGSGVNSSCRTARDVGEVFHVSTVASLGPPVSLLHVFRGCRC